MPRIFWAFFAAMLAAWLSMILWTIPQIEAAAGGLRLLDMRLTGYSFEDVQDFLAALGDEGTKLYLGPQQRLDMVFPPLLGVVIFLFFRWLYPGISDLIIGVISLSYVAADVFENLAISAVLRAGTDGLTPEMVATANQWSTIKWGLVLFGLAMLIAGLARHQPRPQP